MNNLKRLALSFIVLLGSLSFAKADPIPLAQLTTAKVQEHVKGYLTSPNRKLPVAFPAGLDLKPEDLSYTGGKLTWSYDSATAINEDAGLQAANALLKEAFGNYKSGLLETKDAEAVLKSFTLVSKKAKKPKDIETPKPIETPVPPTPAPVLTSTSDCGVTPLTVSNNCALPIVTSTCGGCGPVVSTNYPVMTGTPCGQRIFPLIRHHASCGGCWSMAPVQPAGDVLVQRPIPTISAERLKELRAELPEVIYGEINLLYSTGRYADAISVTELLLDANSQNALAWSWKATLERKQGHYASADLAAERINACLMVQGLDATTLALGLEKIQGADRIYLSNAPQPTSLAVAQEIANRPWRKQPGTQLTSR